MRATLNAKILADGLRFAGEATPSRTVIPIVGDVMLEARDTSLVLTGTDLDHVHNAIVDAIEAEPGAVAVPAARLTELVAKLPPTAEVTLKKRPTIVGSLAGRALAPATVPPADFPVLRARERGRGLHLAGGRGQAPGGAAFLCDQHRRDAPLPERRPSAAAGGQAGRHGHQWPRARQHPARDPGVAISASSFRRRRLRTLGDLAAQGDVDVKVDSKKISLRCGAWSTTSKLIDGTFPDVSRVIPEASKNHVEVASAELLASIERHMAAAESDTSIGLTWGSGNGLTTCLSRAEAGASEELEARSVGAGARCAGGPLSGRHPQSARHQDRHHRP